LGTAYHEVSRAIENVKRPRAGEPVTRLLARNASAQLRRWWVRHKAANCVHETIVLRVCKRTGMPAIDARSIVREIGDVDVSLRSVLSTGFEPDAMISSNP